MLTEIVPLFALVLSGSQLVSAANMNVTVGKDGKVFTPNDITADVGDTITFAFYPQAHTVTQSSLAEPCKQLMNTTTGAMGFDSGLMPVADDATEWPTMTLEVNSTDPLWIYCKPHCQLGMVMSVNAAASGEKSFKAFQETAMNGAASSAAGAAGGAEAGSSGAASASDEASASATNAEAGAASAAATGDSSLLVGGSASQAVETDAGAALSGDGSSAGTEGTDITTAAGTDPGASSAFTITPVKAVYALGGLLGAVAAFV